VKEVNDLNKFESDGELPIAKMGGPSKGVCL